MRSRKVSWMDPHTTGFTALELLLVVTIAAILLALGIPGLQNFGYNQRMSAAINALHTHLTLARNEAIHHQAEVVACPGSPETGCSGTTDWSGGWIVFSDLNGDRQYQGLEILHRVESGLEQLVIHSSSGRTSLRFFPNGSAPGSNSSVTFCDARGPGKARKLVISNLGRIRRDLAPGLGTQHCPPISG